MAKGFGLLNQIGWSPPPKIRIFGRWVERDQISDKVSRYETYRGKLRIAFQAFFTARPLGKKVKAARPIWTAGVYSTVSPSFSFGTNQHDTFDACDRELKLFIRKARLRLGKLR